MRPRPIDAYELLKEINDVYNGYMLSEQFAPADFERMVEEAPTVETAPVEKWIPVTEDAPPKGTICLWCNKQGSVFTSEITYRSERSSYVGKHGYFSNGLENYGDIVAWMPLPKPYKVESEG